MTMSEIRKRIESARAKLRGSDGEGVSVALEALDQCTCGTCKHLAPRAAGSLFVECAIGGIDDPDEDEDFCSRWEERQ